MGTPIDDPPEVFGRDCGFCTPGTWASGETPKFIYAYFAGIVDCGIGHHYFQNAQTFKLEQSPVNDCLWVHTGDVWTIDFLPDLLFPNQSQLRLFDHHGFIYFYQTGNPCPSEYTTYANFYTQCVGLLGGYGGTGTVFWSDEIAALVDGFGFNAGPNLFYEMFNVDSADRVHKFADQEQRTNLKMLLEP